MARPIFSGHESFACKSHWLKRGYDFVIADRNFNDDDAVVHLGVGKNMVASIRFWMKAIGLLQDNELNPIHTLTISSYLYCENHSIFYCLFHTNMSIHSLKNADVHQYYLKTNCYILNKHITFSDFQQFRFRMHISA